MKNDLVVVKDNSIIQASYKLTLLESRVLLSCLAKVDSTAELTVAEGFTVKVSEIRDLASTDNTAIYSEVKTAVDRLYKRSIVLDSEGSEIRWIHAKKYNKNAGSVTLYFSHQILPLISALKSNFTKYRLEWIKKFKSANSIRIYELLVQWQSAGEREVEIDWLKHALQLSDKYKRTNNFIQKVINPAVIEINEYSNINVQAGYRKAGRVITHVQFKFSLKTSQKNTQKSMTVEEFVRQNPGITKGKSLLEVQKMIANTKTTKTGRTGN